jgi:hypothetical protein
VDAETSGGCTNEALRVQNGWSGTPDCRGYERVSPQDKGADIEANSVSNAVAGQSAPDGDSATFFSTGAFAGAESLGLGDSYLTVREEGGWTSKAISVPRLEHDHVFPVLNAWSLGCTAGLEKCVQETPTPLVEGAPDSYRSLYVRDNSSGAYELVTTATPPNVPPGPAEYDLQWTGASDDFSQVIFDANDALTPEAPSPSSAPINLYEWEEGSLRLVNILPDDSVASGGAVAGAGGGPNDVVGVQGSTVHAMSGDGGRVFFTSPVPGHGNSQLYVREDHISTTEVSQSQRSPEDPHGPQPAVFQMATPGGRYVFFTCRAELTDSSNTGTEDQGKDLYRYDTATGELIDLSVDENPADSSGAAVREAVAASNDGSRVYFTASGSFATGAQEGNLNLYMWQEGVTGGNVRFIASGNPTIIIDEGSAYGEGTERVTPDGRILTFVSNEPLTDYDNAEQPEVYLYDADTEEIICVSCNLNRTTAVGASALSGGIEENGHKQPRNLARDGSRLFFESKEALAPGDTNGTTDVYEWEAPGVGTCTESVGAFVPAIHGCLLLISSGTSPEKSNFVDASANGEDAFFITRSRLVPQDTDDLTDLYDARVDGGFASPQAFASCSGEGCREPGGSSPAAVVPGSSKLLGPGNARNCQALAALASQLNRRAAKLRHDAKQGGSARLLREANRLTKRAKRARKEAKHCRKRGRKEVSR